MAHKKEMARHAVYNARTSQGGELHSAIFKAGELPHPEGKQALPGAFEMAQELGGGMRVRTQEQWDF